MHTFRPCEQPPIAVYGILYRSELNPPEQGTSIVHWGFPGDTPGSGYAFAPTVGPITPLQGPSPPDANYPWWRWRMDGSGTVNVIVFATDVGVLIDNIVYTDTLSLRKNGVVVASESHVDSGFLYPHVNGWTIVVTGLAVVNGDYLDVTMTQTPSVMPFWRTPAGAGQSGERFEITGGSLTP